MRTKKKAARMFRAALKNLRGYESRCGALAVAGIQRHQ